MASSSPPCDLPTLRNHYSYFTMNNKQIPILYRFAHSIFLVNIYLSLSIDLNQVFIIHTLLLNLLLMNLMLIVQHGIHQRNYPYRQ
jgi:hypothetical protein